VAAYAGLSDESGHAAALNDRGFVHGYAGDFAAALADHQSALVNLRRLPAGVALDALAATQNNLGFAAWNLGRYEVARAHLDEALALRRHLADRHGEGVTRNNIGNVLRHQGDLEGASREYETAMELCRRSGNVLYEAIAMNNRGQVEEEGGRVERAEELFRQALALVTRIGDRIREGDNLGNLGGALLRRGQAGEAAVLLRRAVALRRDIGDRAYLVLDLSYLALADLALGQQATARAAYEEALAILDAGQEGIEQVQAVFLNGYKLFRTLGEPGRARALLMRAQGLIAARLCAMRDPAARAAFVNRLLVNREIVAACRGEDLPVPT
jgi:tetratricopeptide (TPR) repeat protein